MTKMSGNGLVPNDSKQFPGRLTARSREDSRPWDSDLDFSNCSEIWQAPRQQRCWDACQISEGYDNHNNHLLRLRYVTRYLYISAKKLCIMGHSTNALWNSWDGSIGKLHYLNFTGNFITWLHTPPQRKDTKNTPKKVYMWAALVGVLYTKAHLNNAESDISSSRWNGNSWFWWCASYDLTMMPHGQIVKILQLFDTRRTGRNGRLFPDDIFKYIFLGDLCVS